MTVRHLKIFVAVCEYGGVTRAAEALYIAQPSVSYTISELEKYYNVTLFERINQRLVLTEIGNQLLIKAKEILSGFSDFELLAEQGNHNPTLRIGSSLTLGKMFIPEYLKLLKVELPEISPIVTINKTAVIEKEITSGNLDFGIVEGAITSTDISITPFGCDCVVAVASADFPVPDTLTAEELVKYPLLLREEGSASRNLFNRTLSAHNLVVKPILESVSNECITSAVEARLGISVLPESLVMPLINDGKLKIISVKNTDFQREHSLLLRKGKKLNPIQLKAFELCKMLRSNLKI